MSEAAHTASQGTCLVLDASHPNVSIGLLQNGRWAALETDKAPALNALFALTEQCLKSADTSLEQVSTYIYCRGPGSMLGLRLAAMAIQTWRHLYPNSHLLSYTSLDLARLELILKAPEQAFQLIADWKKTAWHWMESSSDNVGFVEVSELSVESNEPLYYLSQRKGWQSPPERAIPLEYSIQSMPELIHEQADFLKPVDKPEAFQHSEPVFQKWTPKRHGAT